MSQLIHINHDYAQWVQDLRQRFHQSQVKAAIHVNSEKILFYWSLGKDIVEQGIEHRYGEGVINSLSQDLKDLLPGETGLTPANIYYCKKFYLLYNQCFIIFPQVVGKSPVANFPQVVEKSKPLHHVEPESVSFNLPLDIFAIPWGHHRLLIDKFESQPSIALFYARKTLQNCWSRAALLNAIKSDLFGRQGLNVSNFPIAMPSESSDLAKELFNDPINLSFVRLKEKFSETQLKDALTSHVEQLLLELGTGFAYMGREYLLEVAGKEQNADLLFYNTKLHAYVVVEIKVTEFESSYLGQINGYISLVNHILKSEFDNPTIGLLICSSKNDLFAQYCLEGYSQPIGIAAYEGVQILPDTFNDSLPKLSDLEAEIKSRKKS